ncbi:2-aminomuconic semialdehyde dehydrogenase-like isoform X2 [Daphnia pulex]|uniref:2-aminomuconic semialdehyde dehydrogenase-like isoform X2 n=1 Tax=Daphnia pulex TaxID=6669 RepID=UPI001EDFDBC4|nr:2-aminomuconic semialdehyde dehydrogenase-like isoform X2 [Daphnia pulex]
MSLSDTPNPLVVENFIGGSFVKSSKYLDSFDPSTGEVWAQIPDSDPTEVDDAVQHARNAFPMWSKTTAAERAKILIKIADSIEENLDKLAQAESKDQGKPVSLAKRMDIPRAALNFRAFAESICHHLNISNCIPEMGCMNYTVRNPVGVAALISPWNLPLYLLTFKIAPALASGNCVVCKPSEITSVTAWMLCKLIKDAGLPNGVLNMVFGTGSKAGEALINHQGVNVISFTGSTNVGRHIGQVAAKSIKKVSLELGGKNAGIIFEDADLSKVVPATINSCFLNQGEICLCTSRVFVQRTIFDEFVQRLVKETKNLKVGPPIEDVFMGPLVSQVHLEKVRSYVEIARKDGARILCGESVDELSLPAPYQKGYFIRPTIITDLSDSSACMQEEIFGPVVCLSPFDSEEEVIERVNNVKYGLCSAIWGQKGDRLLRVAHQLHVGTVWINCWLVRSLDMPFGGMKESGIGREGTSHSLELYTEETTICYKFQ